MQYVQYERKESIFESLQKCFCCFFCDILIDNPRCNQEFANSEDLDEIQHNAAFHQGLHCL